MPTSSTGHGAAIVAPICGVAPYLFLVLAALRVDDRAIAGGQFDFGFHFDPERRGYAKAETHFLLIAEIKFFVARERRVPQQQVSSGPDQKRIASNFIANHFRWILLVQILIAYCESPLSRPAVRLVDEFLLSDTGHDPPIIRATDVSERHPDSRMKRVVIREVLSFNRGMMSRHLNARRCPNVGKKGPRDLVVFVVIHGYWKSVDCDGNSAIATRELNGWRVGVAADAVLAVAIIIMPNEIAR